MTEKGSDVVHKREGIEDPDPIDRDRGSLPLSPFLPGEVEGVESATRCRVRWDRTFFDALLLDSAGPILWGTEYRAEQ